MTRHLLVWAIVLYAAGGVVTSARADLAALAEQTRQAAADFRPIDTETLDASRARLADAAVRLENFLVPGSDRGERWKLYLKWDGVQKQLAADAKLDANALLETLSRLRRNENGLELSPFRNVAVAIEDYVNKATVAQVADQPAVIGQQLELLAKYLDRHATAPTPRSRFEMERRLYLLESTGALPGLVQSIRGELSRPNLHAELSTRILARMVGEPVNSSSPVSDCILGTSISGTGHTTGYVRAETQPSNDGAVVQFVIEGTTFSNTVGYNGPVVIRSDGTTTFRATKQVTFTDETFWNYPAVASATTTSRTRSVKAKQQRLFSGIIERIASQQVAQKKNQANAIAADHAEDRIARELDSEILPKLESARGRYEREFHTPLTRVNARPNLLHFASTSASLTATGRVHGPGELAADSPMPAADGGGDVRLRLHESAPANFLTAWIGGATLSQKSVDDDPKLDVSLPEWLEEAIDETRAEREADRVPEDEKDFKPWAIKFRRQRPVSLGFADNKVTATIHAARIEAGEDVYEGWDIAATYQLHVDGGKLILIRDGEIDVIPSTFDPADGGRLTNRQVGLRGNLAAEINRLSENGKGFPESAEVGSLELGDNHTKPGPLHFRNASTASSWLTLVLQL